MLPGVYSGPHTHCRLSTLTYGCLRGGKIDTSISGREIYDHTISPGCSMLLTAPAYTHNAAYTCIYTMLLTMPAYSQCCLLYLHIHQFLHLPIPTWVIGYRASLWLLLNCRCMLTHFNYIKPHTAEYVNTAHWTWYTHVVLICPSAGPCCLKAS